jgi:drug/metabolite transporter (DMT)-like permease
MAASRAAQPCVGRWPARRPAAIDRRRRIGDQGRVQSPSPPAPSAATSQRYAAIGLFMLALICFCFLDVIAKWLTPRIGTLEVTWARYVASVACVTLVLNPWTAPGVSRTSKPWLQFWRSVALFGSTMFNFLALRHLQLAEAMSIMFLAPLLIALAAGPLMGEWVGPRRMAAIGVGFIGILIIARPGFGGIHPSAGWSVAAVFCNAGYVLLTRALAAHDSSNTTMFYSGFAGVILLTPLMPFVWVWPESWTVIALMVLVGGFGALGHWFFIAAFRRAPAPILAPYGYALIVLMVTLGYLVFGDVPDRWTMIGSGVVIASGLYLLHRERVTGRAVVASEAEPKR